jgi:hypothetical protein
MTMLHVFISNIFLFNYLVAILSTVFSIMQDEGEFAYKASKYRFIEKYSIAMLDNNGYSEIILHPAPLNVFTIFILPCVIKKSLMKKAADAFSKFIYWTENMFFIFGFFCYEVFTWPLIYFKVMATVFRLSTCKKVIPNFLIWIFGGFFFLLFATGQDLFYLIKILCDYQDEEE